ncbi:TetR/AcrR family transcriptional regulator [Shewanella sp. Choline-02u-19]|jgi:AcrR family transcriptional regulator|uniref:TetR/AcrR family transcriptional regulator n=1 Tax=unclassified Shewanella TaxID=196818 RepID=UPI000C33F875|nr:MULTISPECIES: TetR/AcrR family transcriptional regulator [unclassified Shewanella]PKG58391.1 TetR/AcrR family transcriptional regulator [Shewanella sp. GutDb-MelDb]PKG73337.1 TetR/AcrR family transcriptional regulator [Shewanella sp. GutCb]PKH59195.1 TetR/AcrR family transcriptional regulator [Shewanella sp. Bg11-22]PKI27070.1 TetR/AcrR family transcriptional regulator [Shewanella sp. Choline-02u-19]
MTDQKSEPATQVRDSLIRAARICFIASDYDKVSIRQIAEEAGVNMAMIRYYFGNKLGLFEVMIAEFISPVLQRSKTINQGDNPLKMSDILDNFYQTMTETPDFPRFLFRLMSSEHSHEAKGVIFKLFTPLANLTPMPKPLLHKCSDTDPMLVKMSMMSLMIFPFVIPQSMAELHGFELDDDFYQRLAKHNIKLLEKGLFGDQD